MKEERWGMGLVGWCGWRGFGLRMEVGFDVVGDFAQEVAVENVGDANEESHVEVFASEDVVDVGTVA